MTYQIYYLPKDAEPGSRGYTMFDIEYYMKSAEFPSDMKGMEGLYYNSELHCLPCVEGLTYFLRDRIGEIDVDEFVKDGHEIQELRGLLWEWNNNRPKLYEEANDFHYHKFGKELRKIIDSFCEKYGLHLNID